MDLKPTTTDMERLKSLNMALELARQATLICFSGTRIVTFGNARFDFRRHHEAIGPRAARIDGYFPPLMQQRCM